MQKVKQEYQVGQGGHNKKHYQGGGAEHQQPQRRMGDLVWSEQHLERGAI